MWVAVKSAFRAHGQIYHVGDVVELADALGAELLFCRKVVAAEQPRKRAARSNKATESTDRVIAQGSQNIEQKAMPK